MLTDELRSDILTGYQEYEDMDGCVTIEFSVRRSNVKDIFEFIDSQPFGACWYAMECDTCVEYYGDEYVHLSIEDPKYVHEFCSNLIQQSK